MRSYTLKKNILRKLHTGPDVVLVYSYTPHPYFYNLDPVKARDVAASFCYRNLTNSKHSNQNLLIYFYCCYNDLFLQKKILHNKISKLRNKKFIN